MSDEANPSTGAVVSDPVRVVAGALGVGRVALGLALVAAPRVALAPLGFRRPSATTEVVARLAGVRDLILGAQVCAALLGADARQLRRASLAAAAADVGDAAVFTTVIAAGDELAAAGRVGVAAALPAALTGLWVSHACRA